MLKYIIYTAAAVTVACYLVDWLFTLFDDPAEPPRAHPRIPIIGHVLGLVSRGGDYYVDLR